ncbi:MAG: ATP-dependent Clp protease adaptor ClpS [Bacteroidales bacterium]|jgi:ATP-dependent Clp protease adaptor protein ClpS|nr:ATP-dependent Clp protease adaptor ClpS [Bacteroidales bacterium]
MVKEKLNPANEHDEVSSVEKELILFNDDVNTFEYVIETLIDVCGHDPFQAEQCALTAHFNGRCGVKTGSFDELKPVFDEMTNRELTVTIS